jgi:iron complex outermembrane receptor protein
MARLKRFLVLTALLSAVQARAGDDPSQLSPLDQLLATPISTAAKYDQRMVDVAASVTVVTAEEIERYGWKTLADVLASVRSVDTTYDRHFTYLGVRGVGLPSDYNNRFLILLNGHQLQETVFGSIDVGTGLGIDMATLDHIEFVRGPSSVIYGTGAMFGVINLITKDECERPAVEVGTGSGNLLAGTARGGAVLGGVQFGGALSWREHDGSPHYFPEYDSPDTSHGVVRNRDYDDSRTLIATARWRDIRLLTMHSKQSKGDPTAAWYTTFGGDSRTSDGRQLWALDVSHSIGVGKKVSVRAYSDEYNYTGSLPYGAATWIESTHSSLIGAEARYEWDIRPNHRVVTGLERVRNRGRYTWTDTVGQPGAMQTAFDSSSAYVQAESRFTPRISATLGLSYNKRTDVKSQITPRGALIFHPARGSVVKVLYGKAFRVPSAYELNYTTDLFLPGNVHSESIRTAEVVWEQRLSATVLATVSVFDVYVNDLIRLRAVGESQLQFQNAASAASRGAELQVDYRRNDGVWTYVSYSQQRAKESGETMVNSPRNLLKAGISSATARELYGGMELRYESGRRTYAGAETDRTFLANLNLGLHATRALTLTLSVRNLFDTEYRTPVGLEHVQDTILQDGRTYVIGIKVVGR